jgi:hypothetical protein
VIAGFSVSFAAVCSWFCRRGNVDRQLIVRFCRAGISQRDTTFYDFLQPESARRQIVDQISSFWSETIKDEFPLADCTFQAFNLSTSLCR